MTKRRLLLWSLVFVILSAFAVWLEPTRVVRGWLRGEAFYQGRPTSYWRMEMKGWSASTPLIPLEVTPGVVKFVIRREPRFPENLLPNGWRLGREFTYLPFGLSDSDVDPAAQSVLEELLQDAEPDLQWRVEAWLEGIRKQLD